ncbi:hypothetical protein C7U60_10975 [Mesorhizobium plurifarium]|nr:hypothetical protein C7U60_10975 [Mesorhizobium plurifarium]
MLLHHPDNAAISEDDEAKLTPVATKTRDLGVDPQSNVNFLQQLNFGSSARCMTSI